MANKKDFFEIGAKVILEEGGSSFICEVKDSEGESYSLKVPYQSTLVWVEGKKLKAFEPNYLK